MEGLATLLAVVVGLVAVHRWQRSFRGALQAADRNNEDFLIRTAIKEGADPVRSETVLRQLSRRIERRPRDGLSYLQRGVIYHSLGRWPEAIEDYSQVLLLRPAHVYALMNRAYLWEASGEVESAVADLDELLNAEPSNGSALVLRAKLLSRLGRQDEAVADLDHTRDVALWSRQDRFERIRLRLELRYDLESGERELEKELEADSSGLSVRYVCGVLHAAMGRPAESRKELESVASGTAATDEERWYRAYAMLSLRRWEDSAAEFGRYLAAVPDDHESREQRALALLYAGEVDGSLAEWVELIRRQPCSPNPLVYRAILHSDAGRYHEAEQDLRLALHHAPEWTAALNNLAWLYATCPSARFRNGPEAVRLATRACELTGWGKEGALGTLAAACAECGRFEEAIRWEEQSQSKASPAVLARWSFVLERYRAGEPYRSSPGETLRELQASLADAAGADG